MRKIFISVGSIPVKNYITYRYLFDRTREFKRYPIPEIKESDQMKYDIIIIGAGLGGLTAGAKLAREGKKVLLIEQHNKPGGCATTFKRGDFTLEVGLHEMDGPSPGDMKSRIFNELDVFREY